MNRLIVIGWLGIRRAYLNVEKDEAIRRYKEAESIDESVTVETDLVNEFTFNDEFGCYDAYSQS